jgi:hypothetical protein
MSAGVKRLTLADLGVGFEATHTWLVQSVNRAFSGRLYRRFHRKGCFHTDRFGPNNLCVVRLTDEARRECGLPRLRKPGSGARSRGEL